MKFAMIVLWRSLLVHSLLQLNIIYDGRRVPVRQEKGLCIMNEPSREGGHKVRQERI